MENESGSVEVISSNPPVIICLDSMGSPTPISIGLMLITYLYIRRQRKKGILSFPAFLMNGIRALGGKTPRWIKDWANVQKMQTIEKHFRIIQMGLKKLHRPIRQSETPHEQVRRLIAIIPDSAKPAETLLTEYEKSIFGGLKPNLKVSYKSIREIRRSIHWEQIRRLFHKT